MGFEPTTLGLGSRCAPSKAAWGAAPVEACYRQEDEGERTGRAILPRPTPEGLEGELRGEPQGPARPQQASPCVGSVGSGGPQRTNLTPRTH